MSHKFSITLAAATLAELCAAAADFAALNGMDVRNHDDGGNEDDAGPINEAAPAFDSAGTPWDERIHSKSKTVTAQGVWTRRRNTPDAKFAAVMEELKARGGPGVQPAAPAPIAAPAPVNPAPAMVAPIAAPATPAPPPFIPGTPPSATTPAPMQSPLDMAVPAPAPTPQPDGMQFAEFMPRLNAAVQAGRFTHETLNGVYLPQWQLQNVGQLAADPALTLRFYEWLKASGLVD